MVKMTAKRITDTNVVMATFCLIDNLLKRGRYLFPWWVLLPMHNKLYDILIRLFSGFIISEMSLIIRYLKNSKFTYHLMQCLHFDMV